MATASVRLAQPNLPRIVDRQLKWDTKRATKTVQFGVVAQAPSEVVD